MHPIDMLLQAYKVAKEFRSLQELILFCAEDDTEFVADVEKQFKGMWKSDGDQRKSFGFLVAWKVLKVTPMVYKADYSSLQTRARVENELSVMKDMLTGFKSI
jgi:hypothetical protein